ncbi:MAG: hypothetical protein RL215_1089 [Planctomycetota bacterium]|jgi:hypothetical protein
MLLLHFGNHSYPSNLVVPFRPRRAAKANFPIFESAPWKTLPIPTILTPAAFLLPPTAQVPQRPVFPYHSPSVSPRCGLSAWIAASRFASHQPGLRTPVQLPVRLALNPSRLIRALRLRPAAARSSRRTILPASQTPIPHAHQSRPLPPDILSLRTPRQPRPPGRPTPARST